MLLKQLVIFLLIIQLMECRSIRSNIWWSRRNENSAQDCDLNLDYENPSLEAKICGYCFAKCQQQFGVCLLRRMKEVSNNSLDLCEDKSDRCEKRCFKDKRTSRIAEANWALVVKVLQRYNTLSALEEKQHNE